MDARPRLSYTAGMSKPVALLALAVLGGCAATAQDKAIAPIVIDTGREETAKEPEPGAAATRKLNARIGEPATARWRFEGEGSDTLAQLVANSEGVLLARRDGAAALRVTTPRAELLVWLDEAALEPVVVRDAPLRARPDNTVAPHGRLHAGTVVEPGERRAGYARVAQTVYQLSSAITFAGWVAVDDIGIAYAPATPPPDSARHHLALDHGESAPLLATPAGEEVATIDQGIMQWSVELLASEPPLAHVRVTAAAIEGRGGVALEGWLPARLVVASKSEAPGNEELAMAVAEKTVAVTAAPSGDVPAGTCLHDRPKGDGVAKLRQPVAGQEESGWVAVDVDRQRLWAAQPPTAGCTLAP